MVQIGSITSVIPRIAAVVLAIIVLIASAATIGIINNNEGLKAVRDFDGTITNDDFNTLRTLIISTQNAASWLIFQSIVVAIVEVVAMVLYIFISQQTPRMIIGVLDLIFTVLTVLCYIGSAISTAIFAAAWSGPPELCDTSNNPLATEKDPCDATPLTATNAVEALFCFIQIGLFIVIGITTIIGMVRSSRGGGQAGKPLL